MTAQPDPAAPQSVAQAVAVLASFQKSSAGAPIYSRLVNRPLGRVFAAIAYRRGLSPNGVTGLSAATSTAALLVLALAPVSMWAGLAIAVLLVLGYALDSADGQVARLTGRGSMSGEWLDHTVDCVKSTALHLCVLIGLYRFTDLPNGWLLIPLAFAVVDNTNFFAYIVTDLFRRIAAEPKPKPAGHASMLRSVITAPTDYGVLCVTFVLWGWTSGFLVIYTVLLLGCAGYLTLGLPKWFRDLRALEASTQP